MIVARSYSGVPVRLNDERWRHITRGHSEMQTQHDRVVGTLADPEFVQEGDNGELLAIRFYERTPLTSKFLGVAYRETGPRDGYVLTAYLARRPSAQRVTVWRR